MDFFELFIGDMCINLRGGNIAMAQKFLNRSEVGSIHKQVGSKLVADLVWSDFFSDSGFSFVKINQSLDSSRRNFAYSFRWLYFFRIF